MIDMTFAAKILDIYISFFLSSLLLHVLLQILIPNIDFFSVLLILSGVSYDFES